jgi:hypothetical protein
MKNISGSEIILSKSMEAKFKVLNKIIELFKIAKSVNNKKLKEMVKKTKQEFLIDTVGCTDEAAQSYIDAALARI